MSPLMSLRAAGAFLGMASIAAAAPLAPINSEQSGAAAWVTTDFATSWTDGFSWNMTADSVPFTQEVLKRLNAVTTPAALRAMPAGLALPCSNGGSMTVRMSRGIPRVLGVEWSGCKLFSWNPYQILTGPGQITLIEDTFKPTHVAAISLGATGRDLVMPYHADLTEEVHDTVVSRNVRMIGVIPVSADYVPEGSSTSLYQVNGVRHEVTDIVFANPGRGPEHHENHSYLKNGLLNLESHWANDYFYTDDDFRYLAGEFTTTFTDPYSGTQTIRWSVDNLRIRRITDYANWTGNYSYDGAFTWTWGATSPSSCLSGRFALRTNSPFTIPSLDDSGITDSGELVMNGGAATFKPYSAATVPPGIPTGPRGVLSMNVRNIGTFNYDRAAFPDPVRVASGCQ